MLGILALAAGVALARTWLPEWRGDLPAKSFFAQRYRGLARRAGIRLTPGQPRVRLVTDEEGGPGNPKRLNRYSPDTLAALGAGLRVQVEHGATRKGTGVPRQFMVQFSSAGQPRHVSWSIQSTEIFSEATKQGGPPPAPAAVAPFLRLLLAPGESLGKTRQKGFAQNLETLYTIQGSAPAEHLEVQAPSKRSSSPPAGSAALSRTRRRTIPRGRSWQPCRPSPVS